MAERVLSGANWQRGAPSLGQLAAALRAHVIHVYTRVVLLMLVFGDSRSSCLQVK